MKKSVKKKFQDKIWKFYEKNKRDTLPWRKNITPYRIVVSESMLQQTQVARVEQYFRRWIKKYPTWSSLARARQSDVLALWQGLGYNSRALRLHALSVIVNEQYKGRIPHDDISLLKLPGIGPYTKGAIQSFAFDMKDVFIETNIRTVFIYEFFPHEDEVQDKDILSLIEQTLPLENFREWYWALMDYGAYLKKEGVVTHRKSKHYKKQSKFEGSKRQIRSGVLKYFLENKECSKEKLKKLFPDERLSSVLKDIEKEGFIYSDEDNFYIRN